LIVSTRAKICSSFIPMNASIAGCVPECPVEAIKPDTEAGAEKWLKLNADYAKTWPNITIKRDPPADSKEWEGKPDKLKYFSPNPGVGD
jgi:ferredoxin